MRKCVRPLHPLKCPDLGPPGSPPPGPPIHHQVHHQVHLEVEVGRCGGAMLGRGGVP